jgi:type VI secretion system protein ImpM
MTSPLGFYGKLPGYGDFIERNLPRPFIEQWDPWLQRAIQISQQMLGEHWLDCYLTAPIWRFALSSGCVDSNAWLGLMVPSVDRVGRYFPLTLVRPLPARNSIACALCHNASWFGQLESIALACLNESPTIEAVVDVLQNLEAPELQPWNNLGQNGGVGLSISAVGDTDTLSGNSDMSPRHALLLAETLLRQRSPSFSLWYSLGGEGSANTLLSCEGMPAPQGFSALLTGQWQAYNWNVIC